MYHLLSSFYSMIIIDAVLDIVNIIYFVTIWIIW